jgi:hypothetical protein
VVGICRIYSRDTSSFLPFFLLLFFLISISDFYLSISLWMVSSSNLMTS